MSSPAQLPGPLMVDIEGTSLTSEDRDVLQNPLVGSLIFFTRNYENRAQLSDLCQAIEAVRPGIVIAADYEGGRVQRFRSEFTVLPPMRSLGLQYDRDAETALNMAENLGWLMASELTAVGIDLALTPVVDLDYGSCEVIGDRAFHRDPQAIIALTSALQTGLGQGAMAATAKHFPGHGKVTQDSHEELPVDTRGWAELQDDIKPYRGLINQGLASVMMAHIRYPEVDDAPASLSARWINNILREYLGFNGTVMCDDLSMGGAAVVGSYTQRAEQALAAGCDILPVCNNRAAVLELLDNLDDDAFADSAATQRRTQLKRGAEAPPDAARRERTLTQIETLKGLC